MSFQDQDDLDTVRKQFEHEQTRRAEEAENLQSEYVTAVRKFQLVRETLISRKKYNLTKGSYGETVNKVDDVEHTAIYNDDRRLAETERDYQSAWEWIWKLKRRYRELIRAEREDLQWIWTLERQQREESKKYRPPIEKPAKRSGKQQQRAANWKNRTTNKRKTETS